MVRREVTPQPQVLRVSPFHTKKEKVLENQTHQHKPAQIAAQFFSVDGRKSNEAKHLQHSNSLPVPSLVEQDHDSLPSLSEPEAEATEAETVEGWMMERTPNLAGPLGLHQKAQDLDAQS